MDRHGLPGDAPGGAFPIDRPRVRWSGARRALDNAVGRSCRGALQQIAFAEMAEAEGILHPLNTDFVWTVPATGLRRVTAEQRRSYDERGYFLLRDAFDPEEIGEVRAVLDPLEEEATRFLRGFEGDALFIAQADAITFTTHAVLRDARLRDFVSGPVFRDLGHDLIGDDVRLYWDQAVYKKPEPEREFPWHQDNGYTFIEPQAYLTCWVALTDADESNGCPWVAPGLHRAGTFEHEATEFGLRCRVPIEECVPLAVPAGSIAVFSSLTPHRTGPNRTDAVRKSYIVQFAPSGACRIDPVEGGRRTETAQDDPGRQFEILRSGRAV